MKLLEIIVLAIAVCVMWRMWRSLKLRTEAEMKWSFSKPKPRARQELRQFRRAEEITAALGWPVSDQLADGLLRSRVPVLDAQIAEAIEQGHPESDCWLAGRDRRVACDRGDVRAHVRPTQTVVWRG